MFPEKRCLKMRQGMGPQFVSWGVHFQVEKTKSRCFLCFLALVFLGYFISSLPAFPQSLPPGTQWGTLLLREA